MNLVLVFADFIATKDTFEFRESLRRCSSKLRTVQKVASSKQRFRCYTLIFCVFAGKEELAARIMILWLFDKHLMGTLVVVQLFC